MHVDAALDGDVHVATTAGAWSGGRLLIGTSATAGRLGVPMARPAPGELAHAAGGLVALRVQPGIQAVDDGTAERRELGRYLDTELGKPGGDAAIEQADGVPVEQQLKHGASALTEGGCDVAPAVFEELDEQLPVL